MAPGSGRKGRGTSEVVRIKRIIRKRIVQHAGGVGTEVNAVIAVNVGESTGETTTASSRQHIVQRTRNGETQTTIRDSSTDDQARPEEKESR